MTIVMMIVMTVTCRSSIAWPAEHSNPRHLFHLYNNMGGSVGDDCDVYVHDDDQLIIITKTMIIITLIVMFMMVLIMITKCKTSSISRAASSSSSALLVCHMLLLGNSVFVFVAKMIIATLTFIPLHRTFPSSYSYWHSSYLSRKWSSPYWHLVPSLVHELSFPGSPLFLLHMIMILWWWWW